MLGDVDMPDNELLEKSRKQEILDELLNNMNKDFNDEISRTDENDSDENIKKDIDDIELLKNENCNDDCDDEDNEEEVLEKRGSAGKLIFGMILTTLIIAVSIFSAVMILKVSKEILGVGKSKTEVVVDIPTNSGTAAIAKILYDQGVISDENLFRTFSKIKGSDGTFIAGIHKLNTSMSYSNIIEELQSDAINEREVADVTFPEGITLLEAAKRLDDKGVCSADDFLNVFNNNNFGFDFEKDAVVSKLKFYKMEGYLFPDTYRFYLDEDPMIVAKKIYKNFDSKITPDYYGRMEDLDMTLEETLTLASIVQAESANKSDMKNVASVFFNRLESPDTFPLLQSDPTTNYVEDIIIPNIEVPYQEMYDAYDTYKGPGLPPGPICNPGLDAINAVLYPAETDYYYFCSNLDTGEFFYAKTNEEHEANLVLAGLAE